MTSGNFFHRTTSAPRRNGPTSCPARRHAFTGLGDRVCPKFSVSFSGGLIHPSLLSRPFVEHVAMQPRRPLGFVPLPSLGGRNSRHPCRCRLSGVHRHAMIEESAGGTARRLATRILPAALEQPPISPPPSPICSPTRRTTLPRRPFPSMAACSSARLVARRRIACLAIGVRARLEPHQGWPDKADHRSGPGPSATSVFRSSRTAAWSRPR